MFEWGKQVLTVNSLVGVNIDFVVSGYGHVLAVFAECTFSGGLNNMGEGDSPISIGPPNVNLSSY